jgi:hypothetical protein
MFFLNLWDELDDLTHACRHLATSTAMELVDAVRPVAALIVAAAAIPLAWLLKP